MPGLTVDDRFRLAALIDRLIFGSETTFYREDAVELLDAVRSAPGGGPFAVQLRARVPGPRAQGYAAGAGDVTVQDGDKTYEFDSQERGTIRVGQWKVRNDTGRLDRLRGLACVEIEQVMADGFDDGRTAIVEYRHGDPTRMTILKTVGIRLFMVELRTGRFVPWKIPAAAPRPAEDPYAGHASDGHDGLARCPALG